MRCFMQCAAILLLAALSTNAQAQYYVAAVPQLSQVPQGQVQTQMAPAYVPQIQTQVQQPQMAQYYVAAMPSDAAIVPSPDPLPQVPPPSNVPVLTSEVPAAQVAQVPMQSAYAAPGCGVPNDAAYGYAPAVEYAYDDGAVIDGGACACGNAQCGGSCGSCAGQLKAAGAATLISVANNQQNGLWFGHISYLNLTRLDNNGRRLARANGVPQTNALGTIQAEMDDASGVSVRLGRMLGQNYAFSFNYWQLFPEGDGGLGRQGPLLTRGVNDGDFTANATASSLGGTALFSELDFGDLQTPFGGASINDFFQGSSLLEVRRNFDYRNFEWNFFRYPYVFEGNGSSSKFAMMMGFRAFRADEDLSFFSDNLDQNPGNDPINEFIYASEVENHLAGFQIGSLLDYMLTSKLGLRFLAKTGVYRNRIESQKAISDGNNNFATFGIGADVGQDYNLTAEKEDVAFLTEADFGLNYALNHKWRLLVGYRALAIAGYADAVDQIPAQFDSINAGSTIHNSGSLILHGGYIGGEFIW